jgi:N-acetylglucosamine kinase-like BadF-type ATPase
VCLSDLQAPLHAATADLTGTVLVAGTGAKAVAFAGGEPVRQAGGWGWFLGGGGSGPWIGKRILRAGLSDLDAGLRTPLTAAIADVLGIDETLTHRHVLDHVYAELTRVPGAAGMLAPLVDQVDDPRIAAIKLKAAKHLARLLGSVHSGGPVILAGTVASGPIGQAAAARAGLAAVAEADGLTGAAVHAAATAGLAMSAALTAALRTATARTNPGTNPGT